MSPDNDLKAVCSVTEMARKLRLSRARFYQLQNAGVFPKPVYCPHTRRPFYPLDLQHRCLEIRKTGIGPEGQPILFNRPRTDRSERSPGRPAQEYEELIEALRKTGLKVSRRNVAEAVKALYPAGLTQVQVEGTVIRDLFRYLEQRR